MKIARVFHIDYDNERPAGTIHDVFENDENRPGPILGHALTEVEVPEGLSTETMKAVITDGIITLEVDPVKVAAAAQALKDAAITAAYVSMNTDVYAEMENIFGTKKSDSATAYEATFKLMIDQPAMFASAGLMAEKAIAGFTVGAPLNTAQKVTDYATARYEEIQAYAVWRMQRIQQFYTERAQILAGG